MSVDDLQHTFPVLVETFGNGFLTKVASMEAIFAEDRPTLSKTRRKHSRGFWNTCGAWCFDENEGRRESAAFRLEIMEAGLSQADRCGKAGKFRSALARDDEGFEQNLAELRLLGALGNVANTVDIELPGKTSGRNYDLHLAWDDGTEVHLDSKRREPDDEIGSLPNERRVDIEELLGQPFDAFAFLTLRRNFYDPETALGVAVLTDECRRIAFEDQTSLEDVALGSVPDWLAESAVSGQLYQCFFEGRHVRATKVNGVPSIFDPACLTFWLADAHVLSVRLLPSEEGHGHALIIPAPESQPMLSVEARDAWGDQSEHDRRNPESLAIRGLMDKALGQLPATPYNVVAVAVETSFEFEDVELAVIGEPVPDGLEGWKRDHGIVHDDAYDEISGVLVFTVTPPDATTCARSSQCARYWPNPRCEHQVSPALVEQMVSALKEP